MARTIAEIKQEMMDTKDTLSALSGLTSTSQVSIFGNIFYVTAVEVSILEQLIEAYIADIETIITEQAVGSTPWLRAKVLKFQYGDNVVLDTTTFAIDYAIIDATKQIITRCSVKETGNLIVQVKVAKSDPPAALSGAEVTALEDYIDVIKPAGSQAIIISLAADRLEISGTVYYEGQYSADIQTNVETALTSYMSNLSTATNFDGTVRIVDVQDAIQGVAGVKDVNFSEIAARANTTTFAARTIIYNLASGINIREYLTYAGYVIQEDTASYTFSDTLTYIAV